MQFEQEIIVENQSGLHARPAAGFVRTANKYESEVTVIKDDQEVNGKSIMGILMLAAEKGAKITLLVEGEDAEKAMEELAGILRSDTEPDFFE